MLTLGKKKLVEEGQSRSCSNFFSRRSWVGIISKQRKAILTVRAEHSKLHAALTQAQSIPNDTDYRLQKEREALAHRERVSLEETLIIEKNRSEDLASTTDLLRQRYVAIKSMLANSGGSNQADVIAKYLSVLESRLERSVVRLNEIAHSNACLREEVDSCRRESAMHSGIEKKILEDGSCIKSSSDELMEDISSSYATKDKAIANLAHLRSIADKEYTVYDKQWQELNTQLEQLTVIHEAKTKRIESYIASRSRPPQVDPECVTSRIEICTVPEDNTRQMFVAPVGESAWTRISECTGVGDISDFLEQYVERETQIFSLLNWSNQLQNEIEKLSYIVKSNPGALAIADSDDSLQEESLDDPELDSERIHQLETIAAQLVRIVGASNTGPTEETVLPLLVALDSRVDALLGHSVPMAPSDMIKSIPSLPSSIMADTVSDDDEDTHPNIVVRKSAETKSVSKQSSPRIVAPVVVSSSARSPSRALGMRTPSRPSTPREEVKRVLPRTGVKPVLKDDLKRPVPNTTSAHGVSGIIKSALKSSSARPVIKRGF